METHFSVYLTYYLLVAGYVLGFFVVAKLAEYITKKLRPGLSIFRDIDLSYFLLLGFAYIGMTLGLLTGLSLNPVVHAVIPALLTFLTGLTAYIFIKKDFEQANRKIAVSSLVFITLFLVYGLEVGSKIRAKSELETRRIDQIYQKDFEKYKHELKAYDLEIELLHKKKLLKIECDSLEE
ncbi:MAG: hypothetical protein ABFS05_13985 [Bacteroidota bacterium]